MEREAGARVQPLGSRQWAWGASGRAIAVRLDDLLRNRVGREAVDQVGAERGEEARRHRKKRARVAERAHVSRLEARVQVEEPLSVQEAVPLEPVEELRPQWGWKRGPAQRRYQFAR